MKCADQMRVYQCIHKYGPHIPAFERRWGIGNQCFKRIIPHEMEAISQAAVCKVPEAMPYDERDSLRGSDSLRLAEKRYVS